MKTKQKFTKKVNYEKAYTVIDSPVLTEKSTLLSQNNQYVFNIQKKATKLDIKNAITAIFKVEVLCVNTLNRVGKEKKFKGRKGYVSGCKRAIVRLKAGQTIDLGLGIQ